MLSRVSSPSYSYSRGKTKLMLSSQPKNDMANKKIMMKKKTHKKNPIKLHKNKKKVAKYLILFHFKNTVRFLILKNVSKGKKKFCRTKKIQKNRFYFLNLRF